MTPLSSLQLHEISGGYYFPADEGARLPRPLRKPDGSEQLVIDVFESAIG